MSLLKTSWLKPVPCLPECQPSLQWVFTGWSFPPGVWAGPMPGACVALLTTPDVATLASDGRDPALYCFLHVNM